MTDGANIHEFTVSELSAVLKRTVEDRFGHVRLRAELSGFKRAASGHLYFALKDDTAVMDGVCWRGTASRLSFRPEDGLEVIVTGKLTTYAARSKYQLVVDHMEPAGVGALMALLEDRRRKLAAEGLFDEAARKPLPYLPTVIGVVTSPTGAVIRDILHRLSDRFPRHVLVWPVRVQGDGAAEEIAAGINGFNALGDASSGASFGAPSGPSSAIPSDISYGAPAGPSSGDPSDAPFGAPSGPSSAIPSDISSGVPAGPTSGDPSDASFGAPSGPSSAIPSDISSGVPAGPTSGDPSDAPFGAPSGLSSAILSDISSGVPAGPSSGDPSDASFGAATPAGAHRPALPRPDVLIVARGGGSVEDLWAFNEEIVVRAVAASAIPVISAVGHETDWTLIDHAADRRAPTPTGAAEMAVPVRADLAAAIADLGRRLDGRRRRLVDDRADRLTALARALPSPRDLMGLAAQRFDDLSDRLPRGLIAVARTRSARLNRLVGGLSPARLRDGVRYRRQRLDGADSRLAPAVRRRLDGLGDRLSASARMLDSLSFARVLDRGYALVMDDAGRPVTEAGALTPGQRVDVRFRDGTRPMSVDPADTGTAPDAPAPKRPARKAAPKSLSPKSAAPDGPGGPGGPNRDNKQGQLF